MNDLQPRLRSLFEKVPPTLLIPLLLGLLIRVVLLSSGLVQSHQADTYHYLDQAAAIRAGSWLNVFPNGYSLLIATLSLVAEGVALDRLLLAVHLILSTATIALIYHVGSIRGQDPRLAGLAALVVAVWPSQLNYAPQLMTETPATFFLAAGLLLMLRDRVFAAGCVLGFAGAIRTAFLPVAWLIAAVLVGRKRPRQALILVAASLLPALAMSTYSFVRIGEFSFGGNLTPRLEMATRSYGSRIDHETWTRLYESGYQPPSLAEGVGLYLDSLRENPARFLGQRLAALWELWGPLPGEYRSIHEERASHRSTLRRLLIGMRFPLLVLAIYGLVRGARGPTDLYLIAPAVAVTIVHTVLFANARYTVPAEPLLAVLAVEAVWVVRRWRRPGTHRP